MTRYPFTAIVGQEAMKLALVLNAVNPRLGGVLVRGHKGTAKSTAARGLAALLPPIEVVEGCRFGCAPSPDAPRCPECAARASLTSTTRPPAFVELPLGATEDRVLGTLDLERAIQHGERRFEPGLLARANRGLLYVDEVNLLPDHLVDALLDAAAMGTNTVEREGVSFSHPAAFVLVGTMNPEEGDLRPQLLDRFGLAVDVAGMPDPAERAEVVRRRIAFEADPVGFGQRWQAAEQAERARIVAARACLPRVRVPDRLLDLIARVCIELEVDGLRADVVIYKTAATLAAYAGRAVATADDVRRAAELALPHRRRRQPFDQSGLDHDRLAQIVQAHAEDHAEDEDKGDPPAGEPAVRPDAPPGAGPDAREQRPPPSADHERAAGASGLSRFAGASSASVRGTAADGMPSDERASRSQGEQLGGRPGAVADGADSDGRVSQASVGPGPQQPQVFEIGPAPGLSAPPLTARSQPGRRGKARVEAPLGRHVGSRPMTAAGALDVVATLRAAAPYQPSRRASGGRVQRESPAPPERAAARGARVHLARHDLRAKVRQAPNRWCTLFVVDASGSMAARRRMAAAKGAVLSLLLDAYQRRDAVGLVAFRGARADLLLPPTNSADLAYARLRDLPTGGRTPLASALHLAHALLARQTARGLVVLVSDGRANVATHGGEPHAEALAAARMLGAAFQVLVVDTEEGPLRLGLAQRLCSAAGGHYVRLTEHHQPLAAMVRHLQDTRGPTT